VAASTTRRRANAPTLPGNLPIHFGTPGTVATLSTRSCTATNDSARLPGDGRNFVNSIDLDPRRTRGLAAVEARLELRRDPLAMCADHRVLHERRPGVHAPPHARVADIAALVLIAIELDAQR